MIALTVAHLMLTILPLIDSKDTVCTTRPLDEPLASQDGDFLMVGIFNIGKLKNIFDKELNATVESCSYEGVRLWGIQKALAFREAVLGEQERFRLVDT